jgi:hypothetical protein
MNIMTSSVLGVRTFCSSDKMASAGRRDLPRPEHYAEDEHGGARSLSNLGLEYGARSDLLCKVSVRTRLRLGQPARSHRIKRLFKFGGCLLSRPSLSALGAVWSFIVTISANFAAPNLTEFES